MITILLTKIIALLTSISQKTFGEPFWTDKPVPVGVDYNGDTVYLYVFHKKVSQEDSFTVQTLTDYTLPDGYNFVSCDLSRSYYYYYINATDYEAITGIQVPKLTSYRACYRSKISEPNKFTIEQTNTLPSCLGYEIYVYMKKAVTP